MFFNQFRQVGKDLFAAGLNNSHSGNLSLRLDSQYMMITRSGCMLHHIEQPDLIKANIAEEDDESKKASREIPVHRSIYLNTGAKAVVHAHSPHVTAFSLREGEATERFITLSDAEGRYYFSNGVMLVEAKNPIASEEVAKLVIPAFEVAPIAIVKGHGTFAIGDSLEEAYHWTTALEQSMKIACLAGLLAR